MFRLKRGYSSAEQMKMVKYIIQKKAHHRIKTLSLYKDMEDDNLFPDRHAQGMKNEFKNHIIGNIGEFCDAKHAHAFQRIWNYKGRVGPRTQKLNILMGFASDNEEEENGQATETTSCGQETNRQYQQKIDNYLININQRLSQPVAGPSKHCNQLVAGPSHQRSQPVAPTSHQRKQQIAGPSQQRSQPVAPTSHQRRQQIAGPSQQRSQPVAPTSHQRRQQIAGPSQQHSQPVEPTSHQRSQQIAGLLHQRSQLVARPTHQRSQQVARPSQQESHSRARPSQKHSDQGFEPLQQRSHKYGLTSQTVSVRPAPTKVNDDDDDDDGDGWLQAKTTQKSFVKVQPTFSSVPSPIKLVPHTSQKQRLLSQENFQDYVPANKYKYTLNEDQDLLNFLGRNVNNMDELEDNLFWQEFQFRPLSKDRPWHSMKLRFFELKKYKNLNHLHLNSALLAKLGLPYTNAQRPMEYVAQQTPSTRTYEHVGNLTFEDSREADAHSVCVDNVFQTLLDLNIKPKETQQSEQSSSISSQSYLQEETANKTSWQQSNQDQQQLNIIHTQLQRQSQVEYQPQNITRQDSRYTHQQNQQRQNRQQQSEKNSTCFLSQGTQQTRDTKDLLRFREQQSRKFCKTSASELSPPSGPPDHHATEQHLKVPWDVASVASDCTQLTNIQDVLNHPTSLISKLAERALKKQAMGKKSSEIVGLPDNNRLTGFVSKHVSQNEKIVSALNIESLKKSKQKQNIENPERIIQPTGMKVNNFPLPNDHNKSVKYKANPRNMKLAMSSNSSERDLNGEYCPIHVVKKLNKKKANQKPMNLQVQDILNNPDRINKIAAKKNIVQKSDSSLLRKQTNINKAKLNQELASYNSDDQETIVSPDFNEEDFGTRKKIEERQDYTIKKSELESEKLKPECSIPETYESNDEDENEFLLLQNTTKNGNPQNLLSECSLPSLNAKKRSLVQLIDDNTPIDSELIICSQHTEILVHGEIDLPDSDNASQQFNSPIAETQEDNSAPECQVLAADTPEFDTDATYVVDKTPDAAHHLIIPESPDTDQPRDSDDDSDKTIFEGNAQTEDYEEQISSSLQVNKSNNYNANLQSQQLCDNDSSNVDNLKMQNNNCFNNYISLNQPPIQHPFYQMPMCGIPQGNGMQAPVMYMQQIPLTGFAQPTPSTSLAQPIQMPMQMPSSYPPPQIIYMYPAGLQALPQIPQQTRQTASKHKIRVKKKVLLKHKKAAPVHGKSPVNATNAWEVMDVSSSPSKEQGNSSNSPSKDHRRKARKSFHFGKASSELQRLSKKGKFTQDN